MENKNTNNNLDIEKARKIVLDEISDNENKKEKKTDEEIKISGSFLDNVKKSNEMIASKKITIPELKTEIKKDVTEPLINNKKEIKNKTKKELPDQKPKIIKKEPVKEIKALPKKEITEIARQEKTAKNIQGAAETVKKISADKEKNDVKVKPAKKLDRPLAVKKIASVKKYNILLISKLLIFVLIFCFLAFAIFYLTFILAVTKFNIDNNFSRMVSRFMPVPAFVSKNRIIKYYDYRDLLKENKGDENNARNLILNLLVEKSADKNGEVRIWSLVD